MELNLLNLHTNPEQLDFYKKLLHSGNIKDYIANNGVASLRGKRVFSLATGKPLKGQQYAEETGVRPIGIVEEGDTLYCYQMDLETSMIDGKTNIKNIVATEDLLVDYLPALEGKNITVDGTIKFKNKRLYSERVKVGKLHANEIQLGTNIYNIIDSDEVLIGGNRLVSPEHIINKFIDDGEAKGLSTMDYQGKVTTSDDVYRNNPHLPSLIRNDDGSFTLPGTHTVEGSSWSNQPYFPPNLTIENLIINGNIEQDTFKENTNITGQLYVTKEANQVSDNMYVFTYNGQPVRLLDKNAWIDMLENPGQSVYALFTDQYYGDNDKKYRGIVDLNSIYNFEESGKQTDVYSKEYVLNENFTDIPLVEYNRKFSTAKDTKITVNGNLDTNNINPGSPPTSLEVNGQIKLVTQLIRYMDYLKVDDEYYDISSINNLEGFSSLSGYQVTKEDFPDNW